MTRVLILTLPEKGHYYPFLGPAAALVERGATVAWAAPLDIRAPLAAAGFDRVFAPDGAPEPTADNRGAALAAIIAEPARLRDWIQALLVDAVEAEIAPLQAVLREFRPDVLAMDAMAYQGAIAAHREGIPWICWSTSLNPVLPDSLDSDLLRHIASIDPSRRALFRRHGMSPTFRCSDVLSPHANVVFSTAALVGEPPAGVTLVGPSLPLRARGDGGAADLSFAGDRPLIYASMGSQAYHQPVWFQKLIDAVAERSAELDVALLIAMGELASAFPQRSLPSNVRCVPFAPQLEVLGRAQVAVSHGGANSVMEALVHGVPLLISPICNDQPHNLHFVERAGAGARLDLETASIAEIRGALRAAVGPGPLREGARWIRESYHSASGAHATADLTLRYA